MRFIIFGTGKMYEQYKSSIRKDAEIVAFIDNQPEKWGREIDGVKVYAPHELGDLEYDMIFVMSVHFLVMQHQLRDMGIPKEKICSLDNHIEILCEKKEVPFFGEICQDASGKKILVFSHAMTSTGAQNVLYYAVLAMKQMGHQIIVVSKSDGILRKKLVKAGIPVAIVRDIYSGKAEIERFVKWADMILVNTLLLFDTVSELLKYNRKIIWWIHETGIIKYIENFRYIAARENVSVYAVSPLVKRKLKEAFGEDIVLQELFYGLPSYETEERICKEKMIFAIIGWIDYIKGQDLLLNAVSRLPHDIRERAEFWVVGPGSFSKEAMETVEKYPCIKLMGEIENAEMNKIYGQIDAVVCASREEAMSVAVTEGCMTKKLVIVSNAAGISELIKHQETGIIFESGNAAELAGWIKWAIVNREQVEKIGMASREVYENYFSMEIFEHNIATVIQQ